MKLNRSCACLTGSALLLSCTLSLAQPPHSFASVDSDGDGVIGAFEAAAALPGIAAGFDLADADASGWLDRIEFRDAMALGASLYGEGERSARKRDMFRWLDADRDRAISRAEARWRSAITEHFDVADLNGDGTIGPSEFDLVSIYTLATDGGSR